MPVFTNDAPEEIIEQSTTTDIDHMTSEKLLEILETSKTEVELIFKRLEGEGVSLPEASREKFEEGRSLTNDSVKLRDQGAYNKSNEKAIKAMEKYEQALTLIDDQVPLDDLETERSTEKAIGLEKAVERAYYFADKIDALYYKTSEQDYYDAAIKENIEEAKIHLENALILLDSGENDEAARELAKARGLLGRSMGKLHSISKKIKVKKAEHFLIQTEKQLDKLEKKADKFLRNVPNEEKAEVTAILHDARDTINAIRARIESGDVDEAVEDLTAMKKYLNQVQKLLNDLKKEYKIFDEEYDEDEELE